MTLWSLILLIVVLGVLLWLLEQAPFISGSVKPVLRWLFIAIIVLALLNAFGLLDMLKTTRLGR